MMSRVKVSELSRRTDVSVASIKYYLREGLLPSGTQTANNQAVYDDEHVRRLRLIRALVDIGGLSIAQVRRTLTAVDDEAVPLHDAFGAVMHGLDSVPETEPDPLDEVRTWLHRRGWSVDDRAPALYRLAELVATLRRFGFGGSVDEFDSMADTVEAAAGVEVQYARSKPDRTAAVESMLIGTVVYERVYAEIRRLALESASRDG